MKNKFKYIVYNVLLVIIIISNFSYYYSVTEFDIWFFAYMILNSIWIIGWFFMFITTIFFIPSESMIELLSLVWAFLNFIVYVYILNLFFNKKKNNILYIFTSIFIITNLAVWFWVFL